MLEFILSNIIGPLVTHLICMSRSRPLFENLNDVASFKLSRAKNIRIPVQDSTGKELVRNFHLKRSIFNKHLIKL